MGYSQNFSNAAKCRRVALRQIAEGSGVVFNVSGPCGLGTLRAAKDKGVWGVGVDADQSYLGPHILTSAVMRLDEGVVTVIQRFLRGKLAADRNSFFDLRNGGVGLGRISPQVQPSFLRRLATIRNAIITGKIRVPPPT
jgi:basic membrane protein A